MKNCLGSWPRYGQMHNGFVGVPSVARLGVYLARNGHFCDAVLGNDAHHLSDGALATWKQLERNNHGQAGGNLTFRVSCHDDTPTESVSARYRTSTVWRVQGDAYSSDSVAIETVLFDNIRPAPGRCYFV